MIREQLKIAVIIFCVLTVITGVAYPSFITAIAQSLFHHKANGSLIIRDGKVVGSELIGQYFDSPGYLWGRPSATSPVAYNASSSSGSNIGPSNSTLQNIVRIRIKNLRLADPYNRAPIPVDLVTSSGSGLDPDISLAGAYYQAPRIAKARGIPEDAVKEAIRRNTSNRFLGIIGEAVVNVLKVNLDLDSQKK